MQYIPFDEMTLRWSFKEEVTFKDWQINLDPKSDKNTKNLFGPQRASDIPFKKYM